MQIAVASEAHWRLFAPLAEIDPADARFATNAERVANRTELVGEIEEVFATEPMAHWLPKLVEIGVPAGALRSIDEVYDSEQARSQGLLIDAEHATLGKIQLPGPPLRFDDAAVGGQHQAPPALGQHTEAVMTWLDRADNALTDKEEV